jgi:hypothetical protein
MTLVNLLNWVLLLDIGSSQLFLQQEKMRKYVPEEFKDTLCPKPDENEPIEDY